MRTLPLPVVLAAVLVAAAAGCRSADPVAAPASPAPSPTVSEAVPDPLELTSLPAFNLGPADAAPPLDLSGAELVEEPSGTAPSWQLEFEFSTDPVSAAAHHLGISATPVGPDDAPTRADDLAVYTASDSTRTVAMSGTGQVWRLTVTGPAPTAGVPLDPGRAERIARAFITAVGGPALDDDWQVRTLPETASSVVAVVATPRFVTAGPDVVGWSVRLGPDGAIVSAVGMLGSFSPAEDVTVAPWSVDAPLDVLRPVPAVDGELAVTSVQLVTAPVAVVGPEGVELALMPVWQLSDGTGTRVLALPSD